MESPEERVKIVTAESERLKEYLSSLPPDAWNKPSACERWDVRDVVAHLAYVAEAYTTRTHESLQLDPSNPDPAPLGPVSAAALADGNAQQAISRREALGDQVLSDFISKNDELNQLMATLGPEDWERPHYYASLGTVPMRFRPDLWISELSLHGWDIRSRLDPEAHFSSECLPGLMDVVSGQLTVFSFTPGARLSTTVRYRWDLTGRGAKNSDVLVEGDGASMEPAGSTRADVTFHCDVETLVLIGYGRLSIESAVATGKLAIQGDEKLAYDFRRWFPHM